MATTSLNYISTLDLAKFMSLEGTIPSRKAIGQARVVETVGAGNTSRTAFYLDNAYVINNSYTISKGTQSTALTALNESTHYTLDKDLGEITLTANGVTTVAGQNIYAKYSYINVGVTDSQFNEAVDRAEKEVDTRTNNHFANGTEPTPNYIIVQDEKQTGKGHYNRDYFTENRPIPNIKTALINSTGIGNGNVTVLTTNGFSTAGTFGMGTSKVKYAGKVGSAFTGCAGVSSVHATGVRVLPYVIEQSITSQGTVPTWDVLEVDKDYDLVNDTGKVNVLKDTPSSDVIYADTAPLFMVPNRLRISYVYGNTTIPSDIKRLTLMIASKDIMHMIVRSSHASGENTFVPSMINVDDDWIEQTILRYRNYRATNI